LLFLLNFLFNKSIIFAFADNLPFIANKPTAIAGAAKQSVDYCNQNINHPMGYFLNEKVKISLNNDLRLPQITSLRSQ